MEDAPQIKRDEQYPLLKVQGGGGDGNKNGQNPTTVVARGWSVSCVPKQSWCNHWPEYFSACWMSLILLAISFLVFYALGMSAYRRQPFVVMRCNDSKPYSNVYYHHIIPRGTELSFKQFSNYLSHMSTQYPSLNFYVYFLMDESWQHQFEGKHFFKALVPQMSRTYVSMLDQNDKRDISEFQRKYQNVNISVINLSKYMAMTPLRYKWKTVPRHYLPFYTRIYEIWQNGGIGFDLATFSNQFNLLKRLDRRVNALLKQHNDGIDFDKYAGVLDTFEQEEQNEFVSMLFSFFNNILNETNFLFNTDYKTDIKNVDNSPVGRTHRTKRESQTHENKYFKHFGYNITHKVDNNRTSASNITSNMPVSENEMKNATENVTLNDMSNKNMNINFNSSKTTNLKTVSFEKITHSTKIVNKSEMIADKPQMLLFYDFSSYFDDNILGNLLPKTEPKPEVSPKFNIRSYMHSNQRKINKNYLTISPEGYFIAVSSQHHPFLYQLFSAGCNRLNPVFAIKDLLWKQCSSFLMNDPYCDSIRLIYNIF